MKKVDIIAKSFRSNIILNEKDKTKYKLSKIDNQQNNFIDSFNQKLNVPYAAKLLPNGRSDIERNR